jgi:hypothetical protein
VAPALIALCGAPGCGKSEVQSFLFKRWSVEAVDDGFPMRDFAMRHCGARLLDVVTQAGKAQVWEFPGGERLEMRQFLGRMGNAIEAILGAGAIPAMALNSTKRSKATAFCFGSVRRNQGAFYKRHGATVVEITRKGHECVNEFDRYDALSVDHTITNDGTLADLEKSVTALFGPLLSVR